MTEEHISWEIKFFAKITASMTHELRNVFSITQESSGLMSDILAINSRDIPIKEKLQQGLFKIDKQVKRGISILNHLNRFAHLPDRRLEKVFLGDMLELMAGLTHRLATIKQVDLALGPIEQGGPEVEVNPFYLAMAIYFSLEGCLAVTEPGARIVLGLFEEGGCHGIKLAFDKAASQGDAGILEALSKTSQWAVVQEIVERVPATARLDSGPCVILQLKSGHKV